MWNGGLFRGKQMIKAEELEDVSPSLVHTGKGIVAEKHRDVVMKQNCGGQRFALFVVENQKAVDYGMPARVMQEEAMEYGRQMKIIRKRNEEAEERRRKEGGELVYCNAGERMYRFKESDRLFPVVTLVVYWGEEGWSGPENMHGMMDFGADNDLGAKLKKLVPEYPLHFLDLSKFRHFEHFRTELRPFLELYSMRNRKQDFIEYVEKNERCRGMDEESWYIFGEITRSRHIQKILRGKKQEKRGGEEMCRAMDEWYNDAIEEGKAKGKIEGKAEGKIEGKVEGKAEALIDLLEEYGRVTKRLKKLIQNQKDMDVLKRWCKLAAKVNSIREFEATLFPCTPYNPHKHRKADEGPGGA